MGVVVTDAALIDRLEAMLTQAARKGQFMTYAEVARALCVPPPYVIHQTAEAIEVLMRRHASVGAPQLASMVISKARGGLPAPGYFVLLAALGIYDGPAEGPEARAFHQAEVARCLAAFA